VIIVLIALISQSTLRQRSLSISTSKQATQNRVSSYGSQIKGYVDAGIDVGQTLAYTLSEVGDPLDTLVIPRDQANVVLRSVLKDNPSFRGIFTLWEPDAFDQMDIAYVNTPGNDATGRFSPHWYKTNPNKASLSFVDITRPDIEALYTETRQSLCPVVGHAYPLSDHNDIPYVSIAIPIIHDTTFLGIVGIELALNWLQETVNQGTEDLENGHFYLTSDKHGLIVKSASAHGLDDPHQILHETWQHNKLTAPECTNASTYCYHVPIHFHNARDPWIVCALIPLSNVTAEADRQMVRQISIGIICLIGVLVLIRMNVNRITKPINELDKVTQSILSTGNLDQTIEIHTEDEIGQLAKSFREMIANRRASDAEVRKHRDHLQELVHQRTEQLQNSNSDLNDEISERKRVQEELALLNRDLERTVRELTRSNKELNDLTYITAHDLKTPLRAISTLADWIAIDSEDGLSESSHQKVQAIKDRVFHGYSLLDAILEYSKFSQSHINAQEVDLCSVVDKVRKQLSPPEYIHISVDETPGDSITCDKTHLTEILKHVIGNAITYMDKAQGWIRISCVEDNDGWAFSVSDNGPGIETRHHLKVFQIFQSLMNRDEAKRVGMGLAIVKKLVSLYDGRVWINSEPNKGCTIHFTLKDPCRSSNKDTTHTAHLSSVSAETEDA